MRFFTRNVPIHFYLVLGYCAVIGISALTGGPEGAALWNATLFELPFGQGEVAPATGDGAADAATTTGGIPITPVAIIIIFGFVSQWLEAIRATRVAGTARNDVWSLILAMVSVALFVGVEPFQTFAFLVIVIVAFGDVLLDRIIGQAVAQRDFGALVPGQG